MANAVYNNHWLDQYGDAAGAGHGAIDPAADTFRVYLLSGTYTFSAAHADVADLTGIEATSSDLTDFTISVTGGVATIDAGDVTFPSVTGGTSITAIAIAKWSGVTGTSPLVVFMDTGVTGLPVTPGSGDDVSITWNASGIWTIG